MAAIAVPAVGWAQPQMKVLPRALETTRKVSMTARKEYQERTNSVGLDLTQQ
jgi:hypothetical protein